jgi:CHAT domain-containing protein
LTRPFDRHLDSDEIDELVSSHAASVTDTVRLSEQALGEAWRHVQSCQECSLKVEMHRAAQNEIARLSGAGRVAPGLECVAEVEWLQIAAGVVPDARARELVRHAAQCSYCGPLLRGATGTLSDAATPEEESAIATLSSATSKWQRDLVNKLRQPIQPEAAHGREQGLGRWRFLPSWRRLAYVGLPIAFCCLVGWLILRSNRAPSAAQLLITAYSKERTLELRIPGARHAPVHILLGSSHSHSDRTPELLNAEKLIAENLPNHPDDAYWLHAKGESDLMENDFVSARKNLEEALSLSPNDEVIQIDVATAQASLGNYSEALNILRDVTHKDPKSVSAWFNLAITCSRLHLFTEAVDAWNSYLALDPSSPWADEARQKRQNIEKILNDGKSHSDELPNGSSDPTAVVGAKDYVALNRNIESFLSIAVSKWLPHVAADGGSRGTPERRAIESVAQVAAMQHQDPWLSAVLASMDIGRTDNAEGLAALADAIRESKSGNYSDAKRAARLAELRFQKSGLTAGLFRADFESIYASQLLQQGQDCYARSGALLERLHGKSYYWLETQVELERAICANMTSRMNEAKDEAQRALHSATQHKYGALYLRAVSLAAVLEWTTGNFNTATILANKGLDEYWAGHYPPMAGYNLYAVLDSIAQDSQQWFSQVSTGREALRLIASDPDHGMLAVMHQTLANAALASGELDISEEHFQEASRQLALAAPGDASATFRAVTETGMARMELLKGQPNAALKQLRNAERLTRETSNRFVLLDYYLIASDVFADLGHKDEAKAALLAAISLCENGLRNIHNERERLVWTRLYERSYRAIVDLVVEDNPMEAFQWWEWYKNAPLWTIQRNAIDSKTYKGSPIYHGDGHDQSLTPYIPKIDGETVILSYVFSKRGASAWLYSSTHTEYRTLLTNPQTLLGLAKRFVDHCQDPNSDQVVLRNEAHQLYDILISPFATDIERHRRLIVEADEDLDQVPFDALIDTQGDLLGDKYDVSISPGLLYLARARSPLQAAVSAEALVVSNSEVDALARPGLSPVPRAEEEAAQISHLLPRSHLLQGREATARVLLQDIQEADIFHFSGHAIVVDNASELVVAAENRDLQSELLDALRFERTPITRTRLVVLSACSTAGNEFRTLGEEKSLARMFIHSGVPQVVASRWPVDSEATTDLMEIFYARLVAGDTVSQALREAKGIIRAQKQRSHPYYWASFSVFGSA